MVVTLLLANYLQLVVLVAVVEKVMLLGAQVLLIKVTQVEMHEMPTLTTQVAVVEQVQ